MQEVKFFDEEFKDYRGSSIFYTKFDNEEGSKDGQGVLIQSPARATVENYIKELKEKSLYGVDSTIVDTFDRQEKYLTKLTEIMRDVLTLFNDIDFYFKIETGKPTFEDKIKTMNIRGEIKK